MTNSLSTSSKHCDSSAEHVLYVVLHGLICLIDVVNDGFVAFLNEMGDEHKYLCGDFLAEEEITAQQAYGQYLELVGVNAGQASLPTDINAVVKLSSLPSSGNSGVRATISLPRPNCIHHYTLGGLSKSSFSGDVTSLVELPSYISGIRVFEYAVSGGDFDNVALRRSRHCCFWQCPTPVCVDGKKVAVLHIYNEPSESMLPQQAADHNVQEFTRTLAYLGANLQMKIPGKVTPTNSQLPVGLLPEEVAPLDDRHRYVGLLDQMLRRLLPLKGEIDALRHQLDNLSQLKKATADQSVTILSNLAQLVVRLDSALVRGGGGAGSQVCGGANGILM